MDITVFTGVYVDGSIYNLVAFVATTVIRLWSTLPKFCTLCFVAVYAHSIGTVDCSVATGSVSMDSISGRKV